MKHTLLIMIGILFLSSSYSQDYISYYNLCNQAERMIYQEEYDSALVNFQKAFGLVEFVHQIYYKKASLCAVKMNNKELTHKFVVKAVGNGEPIDFINKRDFKKYKKSKIYKTNQEDLNNLYKTYLSTLNIEYIKIIDSIYYIDQNIIRGNGSVKGDYNLSSIEIPENKFELDSSNLEVLLSLIGKYGFPTEKLVGKESARNANIILHHNLRQPQNSEKLNEFKKYIYTGEYLPSDYAWTYDQSFWFYDKEPVYYYSVSDFNELSKSEIEKINSIRFEIGLKPTEATHIIKDEHSISYSPIW